MKQAAHLLAERPADEAVAWDLLLQMARDESLVQTWSSRSNATEGGPPADATLDLLALYGPLLQIEPTATVAHLGQSLDGRIATACGASHYVTGPEDILHNHRMRALYDAVLVGAGTVRLDDPQLTVRLCPGENPVRVVIDTERRLGEDFHVFRDGAAETLVLTAEDNVGSGAGARHGAAAVLGVKRWNDGLCPEAIRALLAARGLRRVFIEGGGITVSRFLEARCLDRLQVTIAPLIIGSGRPGIVLPQVHSLADGLRPTVRRFGFGADVMFECTLNG